MLNLSPYVDRQGKNCFDPGSWHLWLLSHVFSVTFSMLLQKLAKCQGKMLKLNSSPKPLGDNFRGALPHILPGLIWGDKLLRRRGKILYTKFPQPGFISKNIIIFWMRSDFTQLRCLYQKYAKYWAFFSICPPRPPQWNARGKNIFYNPITHTHNCFPLKS